MVASSVNVRYGGRWSTPQDKARFLLCVLLIYDFMFHYAVCVGALCVVNFFCV